MMPATNPFQTIQHIAGGYCLSRCLHAVAELGVADVLNDTPQTATQLASAVSASADALNRVLRLLSGYGIFESHPNNTYAHSPASRLLRNDHPQSLRGFVRMFGLPINWRMYEAFDAVIKTGEPAGHKIYTGGLWKYYTDHEAESQVFNAAMADKARGQIQGIMASYDFSSFKHIGDIGGGRGHLLQAILQAAPHAKGILFDLPHVVEEVRNIASDRLILQPGNFFTDNLPICDVYVVMEIIHDWANEEATAILKAIRKAAPPQARLLLIETIVPVEAGPDWSKLLDIHMLTLLGGRQRTQVEYKDLLTTAGFTFMQEINTGAGISILEATVA